MKNSTRIQLMIMMFLQFVVWGAWYGQLSKYLLAINFNGTQIGNIYATFSIAMIFTPFFVGIIADRFFNAERLLGILNLIGAAVLFSLTKITDYDTFYWMMLLYCLTFGPCIALTTSISMRQMDNPSKEFPFIRVFGTAAWIAVTNLIGTLNWGDKVTIFQVSMIAAIVMGIYSFTLPKTPPTSKGPVSFGQILGKDAFVLFKNRYFTVFFIASVLICIPLSFYYLLGNPSITDTYKVGYLATHPGVTKLPNFLVENKMSLGQVSEVLFMLLLPFAYRRLGIKNILIVGLIAWLIRFMFFGYANSITSEWMIYGGILLHGICYDFFFVSGMIYADEKAGEKIKSSAQGLISLATYGIGMFIGSILAGIVKDKYTTGTGDAAITNWTNVWMVPAGIAVAVLLLFVLFFKNEKKAIS